MLKKFLFVILILSSVIIIGQATDIVSKALPIGAIIINDRVFLQWQDTDGFLQSQEIAPFAEISQDDNVVSLSKLPTLLVKDEYTAWIWQRDDQIVKVMLAPRTYLIKLKAIDPALRRLLATDGRWFDVSDNVALNRLVVGESVHVYLSFDGKLERILPDERESKTM
jgi:hypothetical protein